MKTMLHITLVLFSMASVANKIKAQDYALQSPDGTIVLSVQVGATTTYSLSVDGVQHMQGASLGMQTNYGALGNNAKVTKVKRKTVDTVLHPELQVKSSAVRDHFNELRLDCKGKYAIVFRAYNNGIAYQFVTAFKKELIVNSEEAKFNFTQNNTLYFPREKEFQSHNERLYTIHSLDSLNRKDLCSLPVLINTDQTTKLLITETALLDYPGMWLTGGNGTALEATFPKVAIEEKVDNTRFTDDRTIRVTKTASYIAKTKGNRSFPWRIIAVSKTDADLLQNQLTYQMATPSKLENLEWIKPGKVAWDWYNYNNIYGVDFKAGVNTETYKYYIDFASKFGIDYIILDEGWYALGNVLDVVPEMDVQELIRYGKEKGVGVILWVTWSSLDQKLEEALDAFQQWGAKGVKVDFMQRDDQWMVQYYERIAKACAEHQLIVDFHGSYKPAGLRRTYPNVLTREGVKGAENNKWANYITPAHNVTLPFIRMVAGPMDYTPGAMSNAQPDNHRIVWNRPVSIGTRCHQLAMYAVFESPLQMLCDSPSHYLKEEEVTQFIAQFPTVWEETVVLHAQIAEYIAVARKSEGRWYLGAMTNQSARSLTLSLDFLEAGKYQIEIFQDGLNADRYASDYKRIVKQVRSTDTLTIAMAPGGGWSAIISKIP